MDLEQHTFTDVLQCLQLSDCVVYGVDIPNTEGKAGMAAIVNLTGSDVDLVKLEEKLGQNLPIYARPLFIRLCQNIDMTGRICSFVSDHWILVGIWQLVDSLLYASRLVMTSSVSNRISNRPLAIKCTNFRWFDCRTRISVII